MAVSSGHTLTWHMWHILLIGHVVLSGYVRCNPLTDATTPSVPTNGTFSKGANPPATTNVSDATEPVVVPKATAVMTTSTSAQNRTDVPGDISTIHQSNTTSSVANGELSTGEIIAIVVGVVCGGAAVIIIVLCLRKNGGYKKAVSAPVTYRKGTNIKTDRTPLTTKDKDPSPLPGATEDHFFYDEPIRKLDPSALKTFGKRPTTLLQQADASEVASLDGDNTSAKDGGEDDFFYDEIFGTSAFTDETTKASIKDLSSPISEELPDLIFKDEFDFDDDPFA